MTGQFYRFFEKSTFFAISDNEISPTVPDIQELTKRKKKEWKMYLMLCKLNFNQQPFRARDLNIFELLADTKQNISEKFPDNILFQTSDEVLLFYDDPTVFEDIKRVALSNGFWVSTVWSNRALEEIFGRLEARRGLWAIIPEGHREMLKRYLEKFGVEVF